MKFGKKSLIKPFEEFLSPAELREIKASLPNSNTAEALRFSDIVTFRV